MSLVSLHQGEAGESECAEMKRVIANIGNSSLREVCPRKLRASLAKDLRGRSLPPRIGVILLDHVKGENSRGLGGFRVMMEAWEEFEGRTGTSCGGALVLWTGDWNCKSCLLDKCQGLLHSKMMYAAC